MKKDSRKLSVKIPPLKIKTIVVSPILTDQEIKKKEGLFFDEEAYSQIINESADVWIKMPDGTQKLLLKFRKGIIAKELAELPIASFKDYLSKTSSIRGKAAGKIDLSTLSKNIKEAVSPDNYKSRVVYKNGTISDYYVANKVHSMIAGFFDKPTLHDKSEVLRQNKLPCRLTAFSKNEIEKWQAVMPLIRQVDKLYKSIYPAGYKYQSEYCQKTPDYCIDGTIFTTITVNLNWRTALHQDAGDLRNGYSALMVAEQGTWLGAYLGYPQYGIAVNLRQGDLLIKDPHQFHANTKFIPESDDAVRMTLIYYYREGIMNCQPD